MTWLVAFVAGAFGWMTAEYFLHRFAGHGAVRRGRGRLWWLTPRLPVVLFHEEHVAHHRDPMYFAPAWKKSMAALAAVPALGGLVALGTDLPTGLAAGLGFAATYLAYEWLHRRIHTHAPTNAYLRWMRLHHLHHHVAPGKNHGVTSPLWDHLLRTFVRPRPVKLHRALAPAWLLADGGRLKAEFAKDYELR